MALLRNEKGYSLLLTLMLILIFTIMGAALIAMTFNGLARNETRESTVQSVDLATKGEQYIIADINKQIDSFIQNSTVITNEIFNQKFLELLKNNYSCKLNSKYLQDLNKNLKEGNITGVSRICVDNDAITLHKGHLTKFEVPLISTGTSKNKTSTIRSTYLMGAQDVKESLKYSVSTFKNSNGDGGNLILHGGSELKGNINVENNLFATSYSYGLGKWLQSTLPRAKDSKLFLGNKIYTFNNNLNYDNQGLKLNNASLVYTDHVSSNFTSNSYQSRDPFYATSSSSLNSIPNNGFSEGHNPLVYKNEEKNIFYDVSTEFDATNSTNFSNRNTTNSTKYNCTLIIFCDTWKYIQLSGTKSETSPLKYNGDLYITGNDTKITFNNSIYVKGDLIIGNKDYDAKISSTYHNITLDGKTIYVEGKVRVQGVNLTANANLYVRGDEKNSYVKYYDSNKSGFFFPEVNETDANKITTRFYELTLQGLSTSNNTGSLIVFSAGKLQIANISEYQKEPSVLTGYFYSEGPMELYGFGSNLKIIGGVSANNLTLNAMRGNSLEMDDDKTDTCYKNTTSYQLIGNNCFEKSLSQENSKNTRLAIEYNEKILDTYSKNQEGLFSNITQDDVIDQVKLLSRERPQ